MGDVRNNFLVIALIPYFLLSDSLEEKNPVGTLSSLDLPAGLHAGDTSWLINDHLVR